MNIILLISVIAMATMVSALPTDEVCPVEGQTVTPCGGACTPTCANPNPICPRICIPGCACPEGQVVDERSNECVPLNQCLSAKEVCVVNGVVYNVGDRFKDECNTCICLEGGVVACTLKACLCPVSGQTYTQCGGACTPTCTNPNPICPRICIPGCACPEGQVLDEKKKECVPRDKCEDVCIVDGETHSVGDRFKDKCNTCTCLEGGAVACTLMACPNVCVVNGVTYNVGDQFKDECNSCTCLESGAACTKKACPKVCVVNGVVYNVGDSFKDECNSCTCLEGGAACTKMACLDKATLIEEAVTQDEECPVKGQTFSYCKRTRCTRTCTDPNPPCPIIPIMCPMGCECPEGQVVDEKRNECVAPDECPAISATSNAVAQEVAELLRLLMEENEVTEQK